MNKPSFNKIYNYDVLENGIVISKSTNWRGKGERALSQFKDRDGYLCVRLTIKSGLRKKYRVHQLVCSYFHGEKPEANYEVRHLDGNKENNHKDNLKWGSKSENAKDRTIHGKSIGRFGNNQKLNIDKVNFIKENKEYFSTKCFSKLYNVSEVTILNIKNGKTWS